MAAHDMPIRLTVPVRLDFTPFLTSIAPMLHPTFCLYFAYLCRARFW